MSIENLLKQIKGRLKENITISLQSSESWNDHKWEMALTTKFNHYPYWLRWDGNDIKQLALDIIKYLDGKEKQPHGRDEILGSEWQR